MKSAEHQEGGVGKRGGARPGAVRVTLLVDNQRGAAGLRAQWGFSAWVKTGCTRVLLDSGCNDAFWRNARALGVPLELADAFVLSHGHFDHGGGIARVVAAAGARLVLHPAGLAPHYWLAKTGKIDPIGLPERALTALGVAGERVIWALGPVEVAPGVWASGPIPRRHPLEEAERNFFLDRACTIRDHVVDDQAMWVVTPSGLVVLVGCAHAGIINTLDYVRRVTAGLIAGVDAADAPADAAAGAVATAGHAGSCAVDRLPCAADEPPRAADELPRVRAVIGGLHLLHASPARLRATGEALSDAGVRLVAPVHCTGKRGKRHLREQLGDAFAECETGSVLEID